MGEISVYFLLVRNPPDGPYEARYGWNRKALAAIGGGLLFILAGTAQHTSVLPLWLRVGCVAFGSAGVLMTAASSLTRKIALRADASGITLTGNPLSRHSKRFCPWEDIGAVCIWAFSVNTYVGVLPREEAMRELPPLPGPGSRNARAAVAAGLPCEVTAYMAGTAGWVLRADDLTAAIARFAPGVEIIRPLTDETGLVSVLRSPAKMRAWCSRPFRRWSRPSQHARR